MSLPEKNIFHLNYDGISEMYHLKEDFQYERPAKFSINLKQQISLVNLNILTKKNIL